MTGSSEYFKRGGTLLRPLWPTYTRWKGGESQILDWATAGEELCTAVTMDSTLKKKINTLSRCRRIENIGNICQGQRTINFTGFGVKQNNNTFVHTNDGCFIKIHSEIIRSIWNNYICTFGKFQPVNFFFFFSQIKRRKGQSAEVSKMVCVNRFVVRCAQMRHQLKVWSCGSIDVVFRPHCELGSQD